MRLVPDTEETKSKAPVERLIAEKERPKPTSLERGPRPRGGPKAKGVSSAPIPLRHKPKGLPPRSPIRKGTGRLLSRARVLNL